MASLVPDAAIPIALEVQAMALSSTELEVIQWLESIKFEKYQQNFFAADILSLAIVLEIESVDDLQELGIPKFPAKKLMKQILELKAHGLTAPAGKKDDDVVPPTPVVIPPTPVQRVDRLIGKIVQLKCSHWAEKGEDGRLYVANYAGADSSTRAVLMSKPAGHLTSTKCNWIVEAVAGQPEQICLRNAYWREKGEDGRLYAANYAGADSSTRPVLMSKPAGHLTSTKGDWSLMLL